MSEQAEFIYPVNGSYQRLVNVRDTLDVAYESQWNALNLTLFCLQSATSTSFAIHNIDSNPILANGTFRIFGIDNYKFTINQYPTYCHYKLTEYQNNSNFLRGDTFNLTSTSGSAKTFAYTASSSTTARTQSATTTKTASISSGTARASATASATTRPSSTAEASSGLSTGAKAGIGVGVALGVLFVLGLLAFFSLKRRRQKNGTDSHPAVQYTAAKHGESPPPEKKVELPTESKSQPYNQAPVELDNFPTREETRAELP